MIHDKFGDPAPFAPGDDNPFYLLCDGVPLPVAVKAGIPEALAFRDGWEIAASVDAQRAYCYSRDMRCWVGGAEDGLAAVAKASL